MASVLGWGGPAKCRNPTPRQPHPERSRGGDNIASTRWLFFGKSQPRKPRDTCPARDPEPAPLQFTHTSKHTHNTHTQRLGPGGQDLPVDWGRRLLIKVGSEVGGGVSSRSSFRASAGRCEFGDGPGNVAIGRSPDPVISSLCNLERHLISRHEVSGFVE